jgi:hypothetical protein
MSPKFDWYHELCVRGSTSYNSREGVHRISKGSAVQSRLWNTAVEVSEVPKLSLNTITVKKGKSFFYLFIVSVSMTEKLEER